MSVTIKNNPPKMAIWAEEIVAKHRYLTGRIYLPAQVCLNLALRFFFFNTCFLNKVMLTHLPQEGLGCNYLCQQRNGTSQLPWGSIALKNIKSSSSCSPSLLLIFLPWYSRPVCHKLSIDMLQCIFSYISMNMIDVICFLEKVAKRVLRELT